MQDQAGGASVLHVVGWLQDEAVDELLRVTESAGPGMRLELAELRAADTRGIEALRHLAERGVALDGVPPLIALMIDKGSA
jgi:hypothetical protein